MANKKEDTESVIQIGVRNLPLDVLEKIQHISNLEGVSYNEVYILAFVKFIEIYEAANGKVKLRTKGKGLENL